MMNNKKILSIIATLFLAAGIAWAAGGPLYEKEVPEGNRISDAKDYSGMEFSKIAANDAYIGKQWGINDSNADVVWKACASELKNAADDVFVVILGSGTDMIHEDIKNSLYEISPDIYGFTYSTEKGVTLNDYVNYMDNIEGVTYSYIFHEQHISGIVSAYHNNLGIAGIDPRARIIPVFNSVHPKPSGSIYLVTDVIYPRLKANLGGKEPKIIIQHASTNTWSPLAPDPKVATALKKACDMGILFVAAAGNSGFDLGATAINEKNENVMPICVAVSADNMIVVGGHDSNRNMYSRTNYSTAGDKAIVHLSAPAVDILSTGRAARPGETVNDADEYYLSTGTSMAAPHVSGAASLLWHIFPNATAAEIRDMIMNGARDSNTVKTLLTTELGQPAVEKQVGEVVRTGFLDIAASVNHSGTKTIAIPIKSMTVSVAKNSLDPGESVEIQVSDIKPYTVTDREIEFTTNNPDVTVKTAGGKYYAEASSGITTKQTVEIYASAKNDHYGYKAKSNTITITIDGTVAPTAVAFSQNGNKLAEGQTLNVYTGDTVSLKMEVSPAGATFAASEVTFNYNGSSAIPANLSVTETYSGLGRNITVSHAGTYTITGNLRGLHTDITIVAQDRPINVETIVISGTDSVKKGETATLTVIPSPDGTILDGTVTWTVTSGTGVASVTSSGKTTALVSGLSAGTATIQAKYEGLTATKTVNVTSDTPVPDPGGDSGGGGGGCSAGFGWLALLAVLPVLARGRNKTK